MTGDIKRRLEKGKYCSGMRSHTASLAVVYHERETQLKCKQRQGEFIYLVKFLNLFLVFLNFFCTFGHNKFGFGTEKKEVEREDMHA